MQQHHKNVTHARNKCLPCPMGGGREEGAQRVEHAFVPDLVVTAPFPECLPIPFTLTVPRERGVPSHLTHAR